QLKMLRQSLSFTQAVSWLQHSRASHCPHCESPAFTEHDAPAIPASELEVPPPPVIGPTQWASAGQLPSCGGWASSWVQAPPAAHATSARSAADRRERPNIGASRRSKSKAEGHVSCGRSCGRWSCPSALFRGAAWAAAAVVESAAFHR